MPFIWPPTLPYYTPAELPHTTPRVSCKKALADYTKSTSLDPTLVPAWYNRGVLHEDLGELEKAVIDYGQILLFDPNNINALINRALVYSTLGQYEPAISDMDLVVGVAPIYIRASAHAELGMAAKYLADLNFAVSLGIDRAAAELNIGAIASSP